MPALHSLCASTAVPNNLPGTTELAKLSTKPSVLNTSANLSTKPSVLNTSADLSTKPSFLNTSPKTLHTSIEFTLPLPDLPTHVKEKILSLEIMGIDSGRVLALNPDLRTASLDSVHSIITYLLSKGIHHKDLPRIFGMCPKLLTSNIRDDLSPVFSFLSKELYVPDNNFRKVINKCPRLLISSVRDQLKPALIYLHRLGLREKEVLAYQHPILLASNVEKTLIPKFQYLIGLGLSREEVAGMVQRCPGLFTFSIENNFKPKYDYFVNEMKRSLEELKEFPQYFTFSLDKRIKPRHQKLKKGELFMPISLMLKSTDEDYKQLIEKNCKI